MTDDELLDEMKFTLADVRMELPVSVIEHRRRARRIKRLVTVAGSGLVLSALAMAAMMTGMPQPVAKPFAERSPAMEPVAQAYAVVLRGDGKVEVTINEMRDAEGLERKLEQAGIRAEIDYLKSNEVCDWRKGERLVVSSREGMPPVLERINPHTIRGAVFTIDPAALRSDETLVFMPTVEIDEHGTGVFAYRYTIATGPVKPCVRRSFPVPKDR